MNYTKTYFTVTTSQANHSLIKYKEKQAMAYVPESSVH